MAQRYNERLGVWECVAGPEKGESPFSVDRGGTGNSTYDNAYIARIIMQNHYEQITRLNIIRSWTRFFTILFLLDVLCYICDYYDLIEGCAK